MEGNEKEGKLDILTWCFLDRSGRNSTDMEEMSGISNHPDIEEEEKYLDHDKECKEGSEEIEKKMLCTVLTYVLSSITDQQDCVK